jgi:flagella basal body P-ring formation protein FlgA
MFMALMLAAHVAGAEAPEWQAFAIERLQQALSAAHPQVDEWRIEPLIGKRQLEGLLRLSPSFIEVTRLGKRSSVRLAEASPSQNARTVWFAVSGMDEVLTAAATLRRGASLGRMDVVLATRDVLGLGCEPVRDPETLSGMRVRRTIPAGDVVCTEALEPRPAVARGESVVVRATAGAVTVTGRAIAEQDGNVGQVLRVRNPQSGEAFLAAVSASGEVIVHE